MPTPKRLGSTPIVTAVLTCFALIGTALVLAAPAAADPGSPNLPGATDAVYPQPVAGQGFSGGPDASDPGSPTDPSTAAASTNGGLPFTGLSAAAMLGIGLLALLAGFGLRRLASDRR